MGKTSAVNTSDLHDSSFRGGPLRQRHPPSLAIESASASKEAVIPFTVSTSLTNASADRGYQDAGLGYVEAGSLVETTS
jgi:hypothetical protein